MMTNTKYIYYKVVIWRVVVDTEYTIFLDVHFIKNNKNLQALLVNSRTEEYSHSVVFTW
jgi:hypothetical protein